MRLDANVSSTGIRCQIARPGHRVYVSSSTFRADKKLYRWENFFVNEKTVAFENVHRDSLAPTESFLPVPWRNLLRNPRSHVWAMIAVILYSVPKSIDGNGWIWPERKTPTLRTNKVKCSTTQHPLSRKGWMSSNCWPTSLP